MTRPASPFAAPPIRRKSTVKRDSAAEAAEKTYVRQRDKYCIGPHLSKQTFERTAYGYSLCDGPLEVDHVRASGGLGIKSPTHRTNMVLLCHWHHKLKTEYGRIWRPLLLAYLERVEG